MTTLVIDHLGTPATGHDSRLVELTRRRAVDELGDRTVWCAGLVAGRPRPG